MQRNIFHSLKRSFLVMILSAGVAAAFQHGAGLPDFDSRAGTGHQAISFAQRAAMKALRAEGAVELSLRLNKVDGTVKSLYGMGVPVFRASNSRPVMAALEFVSHRSALLGVAPGVARELQGGRTFRTPELGLTHVILERRVRGLKVFQGQLEAHINSRGEVVAASTLGLGPINVGNAVALTPKSALRLLAATLGYNFQPMLKKQAGRLSLFARGPFVDDVPVELLIFPTQRNEALYAYRIVVHEGSGNWYELVADAKTGKLLFRYNWTRYIRGLVFDEHPDAGNQVFRTFGSDWVSGSDTRGNNVMAQDDSDANNRGGYRPYKNSNGDFNYPVDLTKDPRNYKGAAVTNLFYWNNLVHDWYYNLGFTEAAGNFQNDNYGRGGQASDRVVADAQDGSGTNNANFATPPDGQHPRMQMYLFTAPSPDRDGDYDADVMIHEYTHGLSNRLVGGASNTSCLNTYQGGAMGEGWGDWFAASYFNDGVMGEYVTENPTTGVRQYNIENSPLTFQDWKNGRTEVHDAGEIWSATLWDVRKKLIAKLGYSAGRNMAEKLVVDGLKLMACNSGFLDARDAILQADQNRNSGAYKCDIWKAFAARGFGVSAQSASANSTSSVTVAYDVPASCGGIGGVTEVEPNNSRSQANPIDSGVKTTGKISSSTDKDYFRFNAGGGGTIDLTMTVPSSKDYDVKLLNASGLAVAKSERGTGQSESIRYAVRNAALFYVYVYGYSGSSSTTQAYSLTVTYPAGSQDTQPPSASITSPTEGATVSGTITIKVSASDNVGVTKVVAWVDSGGTATDTTAPYRFTLDTSTLSNGSHQIHARAWDAAGNYGLAPVRTINVQNGGGGGGGMDESEPNDSFSTADTISTSGTTVTGYVSTSGDNDFFKMTVASGHVIRLDLVVPTAKDYDLYLYDQSGNLVDYSINNAGEPEQIIYTNTGSTGTFYARIFGYNGAYSSTTPYELTAVF